jgi:benzoyl-CoA reductase/2-hydroxyglutaryl-CoA dehydratase subunit BcrC/BadD/HgdB
MNRKKIGITTTVPIEIILAADMEPVDLNNRFITSPYPGRMIREAEDRGFPVNLCAWIKGIYSAAKQEDIKKVIGVTRGDCSSTEKLLEIWNSEDVLTIDFSYPFTPSSKLMQNELEKLSSDLATSLDKAERIGKDLLEIRKKLKELDTLTWNYGKVKGFENHLWLVSASDFNGDPDKFETDLDSFLKMAKSRETKNRSVRIGVAGVPPIVSGLHDFIEEKDAAVVFNEVQLQFAMTEPYNSLSEQYSKFTYPYTTFNRINDIKKQIKKRKINGIIHYTQTFCHRQIESILFREKLPVPVLTIEADKPDTLDAQTKTRIEAFIEQIS